MQEAGLPVGTVRPIPLVRGIDAHIQARASSLLETREHVRSSGGWFPAVSFLPSLSMGTTSLTAPRPTPDAGQTGRSLGEVSVPDPALSASAALPCGCINAGHRWMLCFTSGMVGFAAARVSNSKGSVFLFSKRNSGESFPGFSFPRCW